MCTISSAVLIEGFLSKKEKAAKADNRLIMKFGKQRWRVKLYLTDILELIINSLYNPPIKKYKVSNQKVQKRDVFFAPRFLYPFHTSKGGIFTPFDCLLYFLEGRRVDQIEHDDLIAACLHCGTAAAEGGNRIAQRLTLEGIV